MKKQNLIKGVTLAGILSLTIIFIGCGGQKNNESTSNSSSTTESISKKNIQKKDNLVDKIKSTLQSGKTMKCTVSSGDSEIRGVTYIKNKNMKTTVEQGDNTTLNVLIKDDNTYTWQKGATVGQKMSKRCLDDLNKEFEQSGAVDNNQPTQISEDDVIKKAEDGALNCQPTLDVSFDVPKNIKFDDQCEIMKGMLEGLKKQAGQTHINATSNTVDMQKIQDQIKSLPGISK